MRALSFALVLLALAACSSDGQSPIGIGGATDALKKSPCACGPTFYRHGAWIG
jgi:hypothetical protein